MSKLTLNNITSGYSSTTALNDNFSLIVEAIENTVSRDGTTPNSMSADLDMNGNNILNIGTFETTSLSADTLTLNGNIVVPTDLAVSALPDQTGHSGKLLTTDGASASWTDITASSVDFVPTEALGSTRTVQDKLNELVVSVKDYGAVCNGVTDDSAAVFAANAAAVTLQASLYFPDVTHIPTSTTITVPIVDSLNQLFTITSNVVIDNDLPVRPDWWGDNEDTVLYAIAALPNGGVVKLADKRYKPNNTDRTTAYMSTENIAIIGERMPHLSDTADRLEAGSIIEGRFNVFADGFMCKNVGFDMGEYVRQTYYSAYTTTANDHPNVGGWDGLAFGTNDSVTPAAARKNVHIENVIGLLSVPTSYGHAVVLEAIDGLYVNNVIGVYGIHGVVLKAKNVRGGDVAGYMASTDNVIIKSDSYAVSGDIQLTSVVAKKTAPNVTPHTAPTAATYGLYLNPATASFSGPVQIGKYRSDYNERAFLIRGGATYSVTDVQIDSVFITNASVLGVGMDTCIAYRVNIGNLIANTVGVGIAWDLNDITYASEPQLTIQSCELVGVSNWALQASSYARVWIDQFVVKTAGYAYYNEDDARILIGKESLSAVVSKWYTSGLSAAPAVAGLWTNSATAGYNAFAIRFENYGVVAVGTLDRNGGNTVVATLPPYLQPNYANIQMGTGFVSPSTYSAVPCSITAGGNIATYEGTSTGSIDRLTIDGFYWQHW